MDTFESIRNRRSIRAFNDRHIPDELISRCLEAARWAPSGGNTQPWSFVVTRDREKMVRFDPYHHQPWVEKAPVCIVCCVDPSTKRKKYDESMENLFISYLDLGAAIQNFLLAAWEVGLGTVWVAAFSPKKVRELCQIPDQIIIASLICVGYFDEQAEQTYKERQLRNQDRRPRHELEKFCYDEMYGVPRGNGQP